MGPLAPVLGAALAATSRSELEGQVAEWVLVCWLMAPLERTRLLNGNLGAPFLSLAAPASHPQVPQPSSQWKPEGCGSDAIAALGPVAPVPGGQVFVRCFLGARVVARQAIVPEGAGLGGRAASRLGVSWQPERRDRLRSAATVIARNIARIGSSDSTFPCRLPALRKSSLGRFRRPRGCAGCSMWLWQSRWPGLSGRTGAKSRHVARTMRYNA